VGAYDLQSGKILWQYRMPAPYTMNEAATAHGKGPKSTPVLSEGLLFTFSITGVLTALDARSGQVQWRQTFADRFPSTSPTFGTAMSPVVFDGLLIAHVGGDGKGALSAFEARSGRLRWRWTQDGPAYASPVVATFDGTKQVVAQTQHFVVGLSVADGKRLWTLPFTTEYDQNCVTPVVFQDTILLSGLFKGLFAVRPVKRGLTWTVESFWQNDTVSMYMSTPVVIAGRLFGLSHRNKGQFVAVDASTGKTLWIAVGRQGENAAIAASANLLFSLTDDGVMTVAAANPSAFQPLQRYDVASSPTWASPVVLNDGFMIKDEGSLTYWRLR